MRPDIIHDRHGIRHQTLLSLLVNYKQTTNKRLFRAAGVQKEDTVATPLK